MQEAIETYYRIIWARRSQSLDQPACKIDPRMWQATSPRHEPVPVMLGLHRRRIKVDVLDAISHRPDVIKHQRRCQLIMHRHQHQQPITHQEVGAKFQNHFFQKFRESFKNENFLPKP